MKKTALEHVNVFFALEYLQLIFHPPLLKYSVLLDIWHDCYVGLSGNTSFYSLSTTGCLVSVMYNWKTKFVFCKIHIWLLPICPLKILVNNFFLTITLCCSPVKFSLLWFHSRIQHSRTQPRNMFSISVLNPKHPSSFLSQKSAPDFLSISLLSSPIIKEFFPKRILVSEERQYQQLYDLFCLRVL